MVNTVMKTVSGLAMGVALLVAGVVFAEDKAAANTAPVGQVCKQGEACASAAAATGGTGAAKSGEDVFKSACTSCHSTGAAGAPKVGDAAAWSARLTERGGIGLYGSALKGFKGMPAKGLCFACTDDA